METDSCIGALGRERTRQAPLVRRVVSGYRLGAPEAVTDADLEAVVRALRPEGYEARLCLGQRPSALLAELPQTGPVVIKEYLRRGLVRHLVKRTHVRRLRTRPEREFRMLAQGASAGARVPVPVAAVARGNLLYRGWLVTRLVADARPLVDYRAGSVSAVDELLRDVARQIALLIDSRILHVDLQPGNVIVDADGRAHLLDFDRAVVFPGPRGWMRWVYRARWRHAVKKHLLPPALARLPELINGAS